MEVFKIGKIIGVTLESRPDYQEQLFIIPPWTKIPEHSHDDVNNYIMFLGGTMRFSKSDKSKLLQASDIGRGWMVSAGELHSAETEEDWACFLTKQYWLNNRIRENLHLNWKGPAINDEHQAQLIATCE